VPFVFGLQFYGGYCSVVVIMVKHRPYAVSFLHCIGSVPLYIYPILTLLLNQDCGVRSVRMKWKETG
jgi:hypothetical protein